MTITSKLGAGIITISIGTISSVAYASLSSVKYGTPISDLIAKEYDYILLSDDNNDKDKWEAVWKDYKENSQNVFKLAGWKKNGEFNLTEELKKKCRDLSGSKVSNNSDINYKNVTRYCARGVTFEEQARKEGITIFDIYGNSHAAEFVQKLREKTQLNATFQIIDSKQVITNAFDIKNLCTKARLKNKQVDYYQTIYGAYKKVCTRERGR